MITSSGQNFSLPREVGSGVRLSIFAWQAEIFIGLLFMVMGTVAAVAVFAHVDFRAPAFSGNEPTVYGKLLSISNSGYRRNRHAVYAYDFSYRTPDHVLHNGKSFAPSNSMHTGDGVLVEYIPGNPGVARIRGMNTSPVNPGQALFVLVLPAVGFIAFIIGIRRAKKNLYLVRNGIMVTGTVTRKEPTKSKVNSRTVYRVFFRFHVNGVEQEAVVRTHRPERVTDEAEERILYDPNRPAEATMVDVLPKTVRKFFDGQS